MGGDVKKSGFSHEFLYEPPPRPDVFFDARSDEDSAPSEPPYMPDGRGGGGGGGGGGLDPPPPPPPPGNLGALQGLFGTRTGNMPIQSGYYAPQFSQNPVMMPVYPNAPYNILAEEGMCPDIAPPPQPGFFQQMGRNIADSAREGAINQAGQIGAAVGAGAVGLAGQALQRVGGAIRDGAVRMLNWEDGYLFRAADAMGDRVLYPFGLGRLAAAQPLAEPLLGGVAAAEGAEIGGAAAAGLGALGGA